MRKIIIEEYKNRSLTAYIDVLLNQQETYLSNNPSTHEQDPKTRLVHFIKYKMPSRDEVTIRFTDEEKLIQQVVSVEVIISHDLKEMLKWHPDLTDKPPLQQRLKILGFK